MKSPVYYLFRLLFWFRKVSRLVVIPKKPKKNQKPLVKKPTPNIKLTRKPIVNTTQKRKFKGKLNGFKSSIERNFHKKWLKAYLKGAYQFQFHGKYYLVN